MRRTSISLLIVLSGLFLTSLAPSKVQGAEEFILWRDTFDVSATSPDLNFEHATRQAGGLLGPYVWIERADTALGGARDAGTLLYKDDKVSQLWFTSVNGPFHSTISPNHNFVEKSR